jgi:hypothetical protein
MSLNSRSDWARKETSFRQMVVQVEDTSIQIFVGSEMRFRSDLRETFTGTVLHRIAWPR